MVDLETIQIYKSKRRRTVGIRVFPDLQVKVYVPYYYSNKRILKLIEKHSGWIIKKQSELAIKNLQIKMLTGMRIIQQDVFSYYKEQASYSIPQRVKYFSDLMGVQPNKVKIKAQKSRWGSCSSKKNINLNWKIVLAPSKVMDYLIVHELAHLKHMNHSKRFWAFVESIIPDYKEMKRELRAVEKLMLF